jgi:hypothetical protein
MGDGEEGRGKDEAVLRPTETFLRLLGSRLQARYHGV